jgi:hypothetical protein
VGRGRTCAVEMSSNILCETCHLGAASPYVMVCLPPRALARAASARLHSQTASSGALSMAPGTIMPPRSPMSILPKRSA